MSGASLLGAFLVPVTFVTYLYGRLPDWEIPLPTLAVCFLRGEVLGTVVVGTLEYDLAKSLGFVPKLGIGLIEESAKPMMPLVFYFLGSYHSAGGWTRDEGRVAVLRRPLRLREGRTSLEVSAVLPRASKMGSRSSPWGPTRRPRGWGSRAAPHRPRGRQGPLPGGPLLEAKLAPEFQALPDSPGTRRQPVGGRPSGRGCFGRRTRKGRRVIRKDEPPVRPQGPAPLKAVRREGRRAEARLGGRGSRGLLNREADPRILRTRKGIE